MFKNTWTRHSLSLLCSYLQQHQPTIYHCVLTRVCPSPWHVVSAKKWQPQTVTQTMPHERVASCAQQKIFLELGGGMTYRVAFYQVFS